MARDTGGSNFSLFPRVGIGSRRLATTSRANVNLAEDTEGGGRQEEGACSYGCDKGVLAAVTGSSDLSEGSEVCFESAPRSFFQREAGWAGAVLLGDLQGE